MKVAQLTRKFKYNGVDLADPNPNLPPEKVKEVYANVYPELTNSAIEGPTTKNGVAVYQFIRAVGSKGASPMPASQVIKAALDGSSSGTDLRQAFDALTQADARAARNLCEAATSRSSSPALPLPATAFGLWG